MALFRHRKKDDEDHRTEVILAKLAAATERFEEAARRVEQAGRKHDDQRRPHER